jgi:hypothetical protein
MEGFVEFGSHGRTSGSLGGQAHHKVDGCDSQGTCTYASKASFGKVKQMNTYLGDTDQGFASDTAPQPLIMRYSD